MLDLTQHATAAKPLTAEENAASIEAKFENAGNCVRTGRSGIQHGGKIIEHAGVKIWRWLTGATSNEPDIEFTDNEDLRGKLP